MASSFKITFIALKGIQNFFEKIFNEKVEINEIPKSKRAKYKKELFIAEIPERYFHRDENLQPYWYTFNIDCAI